MKRHRCVPLRRCTRRVSALWRKIALAAFACSIAFTCTAAERPAIWIDTDCSIGAFYREVDDAYALILAFHSPEVRIAGLSTSYGNAGLNRTTQVGRQLVGLFGGTAGLESEHVFPGAESAQQLGRSTQASTALARAVQKERITYVALAPLTNLAGFLQLHPKLAARIGRVIMVGGKSPGYPLAFGPNDRLRIHDANVFKDPAAVGIVLASGIPITLAPIETSSQLTFDQQDLRRLRTSSPAGEFLARRSGVWSWFWTTLVREEGGPVFDLLAVLSAIKPQLVRTEARSAHLDPEGNLLALKQFSPGKPRVQFYTAMHPTAKEFVLRRLQRRSSES